MTQALRLPVFPIEPLRPRRSALHWLVRTGDRVGALQPIAYCNVEFAPEAGAVALRPFLDDGRDMQLVLVARSGGTLRVRPGFSNLGGWMDLHGYGLKWDGGATIADLDEPEGQAELLFYFVSGRRGFEFGEGRGGLLTGWHDRVRAFWPGNTDAAPRTLVSLGSCEQLHILRGEKIAFADWFKALQGPTQLVLHTDDRMVHSSAVLLQQLRRTPAEARAILESVQAELSLHASQAGDEPFAALLPEAPREGATRRNLLAHDLLFAQNLLAESLSPSPMVDQLDFFSQSGLRLAPAPELVLLSMVSECISHFRHRKTGWLIAIYGYRFRDLGPVARAWLQAEFEPVKRSLAAMSASLAELAGELRGRTGARLMINNLISTTSWDRVPNYAWLGDAFAESNPVFTGEANLMLEELASRGLCTVVDVDAVTAEQGGLHCPDRVHASGPLPAAFRAEMLSLLARGGGPALRVAPGDAASEA